MQIKKSYKTIVGTRHPHKFYMTKRDIYEKFRDIQLFNKKKPRQFAEAKSKDGNSNLCTLHQQVYSNMKLKPMNFVI